MSLENSNEYDNYEFHQTLQNTTACDNYDNFLLSDVDLQNMPKRDSNEMLRLVRELANQQTYKMEDTQVYGDIGNNSTLPQKDCELAVENDSTLSGTNQSNNYLQHQYDNCAQSQAGSKEVKLESVVESTTTLTESDKDLIIAALLDKLRIKELQEKEQKEKEKLMSDKINRLEMQLSAALKLLSISHGNVVISTQPQSFFT